MGFLWYWIPDFALLARPLHRAAKPTPRGPRTDPSPVKHLLSKREDCLTLGPVSALPDPPKPPYLLTDERSRSAPRLLVQPTGPTERTRAYLSQQLDVAAQGWQPCLRALAGAASLTKEALRLTLQGPSPFSPLTAWDTDLLSQKSVSHLDPARLQLDLLLFIENPDIYHPPTSRLNPAPLLRVGTPPATHSEPSHSCPQLLHELTPPRRDFPIKPSRSLTESSLWMVVLSSPRTARERHAAYAVVAYPRCRPGGGCPPPRDTTYTASKYASLITHTHSVLWQERGCLTTKGTTHNQWAPHFTTTGDPQPRPSDPPTSLK